MNSFQVDSTEFFLLIGATKLTLLLGCLWGAYIGMPRVSPLWKARFWRIGAVLVLLVAVLCFIPPQLTLELARPGNLPELQVAELQTEPLQSVKEENGSPSVTAPFDTTSVAVNHARVESLSSTALHKPIRFSTVVIGIWLAGVLLMLFHWLAIAWKTRLVCRSSVAYTGGSQDTVSSLAAKLGIRWAPLVFRAEVASPCLVYCPSPAILLPGDFDVSQATSRGVFAHELAHLKRRDWQWNIVFTTLQTILWFHPLVWKIRSTHMNDCENACDDLAAELTGGRSAYQQTLAKVALEHANQSVVVGLSMVRKPEIILRLKRLGLPVEDFSLKKLVTVLSVTAFVSTLIATFGIAYIDGTQDDEKTKATSNDYSFQLAIADDELKNATIDLQWYHTGDRKAVTRNVAPEKDGWVRGTMGTESLSSVTIVCRAPGHVPFAITRHARNRSIVLPQDETIFLEKARSLSGLVRDSDGKPIQDAVVKVGMASQNSWDRSRHFTVAKAKTDAKGKWTIKTAPWNLKAAKVNISISHPDYLAAWGSVPEYPNGEPGSKARMLRGVEKAGTVVDVNGNPIEAVRVTLGYQRSGIQPRPPEDLTDPKGRFELPKCRPGSRFIVASKNGFAPELVELTIEEGDSDPEELKLVLKPGKTIKARLRDQNGDPVVDAMVAIQTWRKDHSLGFHTRTDSEGRFEWHDAPYDDVWFTFSGKEHRLIVHHKLNHSEEEHEVLLYTQQKVHLKVVDADTNALIQNAYAMRGLKFSADGKDALWDGTWTPFVNGEVEYSFRRSIPETWLKIKATGYQTHVEKFKLGEKDKVLTLKLKADSPIEKTDDVPSDQIASVRQLKKLGAKLSELDSGVWKVKLVGPWEIPSAMRGVPNINVNPGKALWTGGLQDFELLRALPQVDLTLDGFHVGDEFMENLCGVESIVSLDLDNSPWELSTEGCELLGRLKSVRSLNLDGHWQKFQPEAIEAMAKMSKLESLVFDSCGAYHMDERTFRGRLSKLVNLKHLELNSNKGFGNAIGDEISQLKQLESLRVRGRALGDKFIEKISKLQLRKLKLSMTGITDTGLKNIADSFPGLVELNVERTGVTVDGIRSVMAQFPALRKLTVEMLDDGKTLLDFKRRHRDCAIYPIVYGRGSVMSLGAIELPESDRE